MKKNRAFWVSLVVVVTYLFGAFHYYRFSRMFVVQEPTSPGLAYVDALITVAEEMDQNWMPNDIFFWPSNLNDNPQNFQRGELEAVRYATRILRDHLSRMSTTDTIDPDCEIAFTAFSNDPEKLYLPRAEEKYEEGIEALKRYRARLERGEVRFYPRADNLNEFIVQFTSLLGGMSQRLANAPRDIESRISEETAGDATLSGEKRIKHHTPWTKIDDDFYFVQGVLFVLKHLVVATSEDFSVIIEQRNAEEFFEAITDVLDHTQFRPWIVLNGNPGSVWANHPMQLQARLEDVRQKLRLLQSVFGG